MRIITRAAVALAGAAPLGLGLVAVPATAAELGDDLVVDFGNTTFKAGSWGEGVTATVEEVPEEVETLTVAIGSMGENGGGLVDEAEVVQQEDGSWVGTVRPSDEYPPVAPNADGWPKYTASVGYQYEDEAGETQYVNESIELTITEGVSVTGPEEATVAELAAGIPLQFAGFNSGEVVTGDIRFFNEDTGEEESIGDFETEPLGQDGAGEGALTITGASVGQQFRVVASGEAGTVNYYVRVVEGGDVPEEPPAPEQPGPEQPRKPERVDTGA